MLETKQKYCRCLQIHQHGGTQKQTCSEGEMKKLFQTFNSEDVRRGRLLHHTQITREEKPEDEQMSTEDNVPDVRHGRPDDQPEPKRSGKRQGRVVGPSQPSLSVLGPEEERMTTANASTDVEEPYRGERRVRTWDNQTPPQPKTLTPPLTMPQNKKHRARVAKYLDSMKWKWVPHGKKNNNRGRQRRKPTTCRATRSMGPFKSKSTSDT